MTLINDLQDYVEIIDLDVIYLSYDEPQKEDFWIKIKNLVPWAKRVDGIKGSDNAHKKAAELSDTERFILIDGDNLPNEDFFNLTFDFRNKDHNYKLAQYRWRAKNYINGLQYGNGGISSWTKSYVKNMKTHENSEGDKNHTVDFCLDSNDGLYWAMHDCYSTTYPNYSSFQAWRAGFREGVKMCLLKGEKPNLLNFNNNIPNRNLNNLTVWHNVGLDIENGIWAIYGSRLGTYFALLTDYNINDVQWFDNFNNLWEEFKNVDPERESVLVGSKLEEKLNLPMCILDKKQSIFFKRHYSVDKKNMGILVKEIDVIRKLEGW